MNLQRFVQALQQFTASIARFQVELQGRYSRGRLRAFVEYSKSATLLRVALIIVITAIPCALGIVLVDVLPLQPPSSGLTDQTAAYWTRSFYSGIIVTGGVVVAAPWQIMLLLFTAFWTRCKDCIRTNPDIKRELLCFLQLWTAEVAMIIIYPVLNYVFRRLDGQSQTIFSMVLPLWKLALKNWCGLGTNRLEDLAPVLVVFNVDVFHALFLASSMQSSSTTGSNTLVVVMSIDFIQSCVAIMEVYLVCARLKQLEGQINSTDIEQTRQTATSPSARHLHLNTIEYADNILSSDPPIREQLTSLSAKSRQLRWSIIVRPLSSRMLRRGSTTSSRVYMSNAIETPSQPGLQSRAHPGLAPSQAEKLNQAKLAYVQANLKLLHMVEFYMLIEFTEVLIAVVYSIYLFAMAHLPNRQYYLPLQALTEDQFADTVRHVMKYAALELLSFVLLAMVFDRMLRISTLRQLAFTLEKHWLLVQSLLVLWVFFPTQMTLEHLGCDYTFKFAWLH